MLVYIAFFSFLMVLGFELKAFYLLGIQSTTGDMTLIYLFIYFAFSYFSDRVSVFA
jgi:hypothetical protein